MFRNAVMLGLLAGAGLVAQPAALRAQDTLNLAYHGNAETVPANWGHSFGYGYGCSNCGTGYAPYASYGYAGAPAYGYGYATTNYWGGTFGGYGHGSYYGAPAGYWRAYAPSYNWGFAAPSYGYGYGYGYSYPNTYFNYVYPTAPAYYSAPAYYTPSYYYYQPSVWGVPYGYAAPGVTNVFANTTNVAVAYPQATTVVPQATAPLVPMNPAIAPSPGFDYDGGPRRLVPMPRNDVPAAPASNIYNIHLTDSNEAFSKYAYKAYGEKSEAPATVSDTVLVKRTSR